MDDVSMPLPVVAPYSSAHAGVEPVAIAIERWCLQVPDRPTERKWWSYAGTYEVDPAAMRIARVDKGEDARHSVLGQALVLVVATRIAGVLHTDITVLSTRVQGIVRPVGGAYPELPMLDNLQDAVHYRQHSAHGDTPTVTDPPAAPLTETDYPTE